MKVNLIECEQGTPQWDAARIGIASASEFSTVLAEGKQKGSPSVTRAKYMRKLAAEIICRKRIETYKNGDMDRGHEVEPQARGWYQLYREVEVKTIGFAHNLDYHAGCSPDGLIGDDGGVEIKSRRGDLQIELIEDDRIPSEHIAQLQGSLWVTGRKWWDFVSYCEGLPGFCRRVFPDLEYHARLQREVAKFNAELVMLVKRISL